MLRFAIACGWLYPALRRQGDTERANEVKGWLMKATDVLLSLQLPWNGVFVDDEGSENCQVDVAGGLFSAYRIVNGVPRPCRYSSRLEELTSLAGAALPQIQQRLVPSPHTSHYELSIGVILAFALAYHAVDDGQAATPTNWPPVADAGNDQMVAPGNAVTLDGSWSTDSDGDPLSYSWTQPAGPRVTLSSTTATSPTFTAPSTPTTLTFKLRVSDGRDGSDTDTVTIRVNRPPVAVASASPSTVAPGALVTLDGSASSDPDGDTLTYSWEQAPGVGGGGIELSDPTAVSPTFVAPSDPAALTFKLTVSDGRGGEDTGAVSVTVRDPAPTAPANLSAEAGDGQTTLSWDNPNDAAITGYEYRLRSGTNDWGSWAAIPSSGAATVAYVKAGLANGTEYSFQLRAVNAHGAGPSAEVGPVTPSAPNRPPVSDAGPDQVAGTGVAVTLDGTASRDMDSGGAISYIWRQTEGPRVSLAGADTAGPTFTVPSSPTYLRFRLTVTDGRGASDIDAVVVRVTDSPDGAAVSNLPPAANAGGDQTVDAGASVTLDGSGSGDPNSGDTLTYAWRQTVGPSVTLGSTTTTSPTFTAPSSATTLRFRLTVTDPHGAIDTDAVVITVR